MANAHNYAAKVTWTDANSGGTTSYQAYSREYEFSVGNKQTLKGSADPHFRGDPALYNPEELLVVALSTCHLLSYLAECARAGVNVVAYEDDASGTMQMKDRAIRFTDVLLKPRVTIAAGSDAQKAEALHAKAHAECFIANSVNFPVRHDATIVVADH
jgi:organic hydroperoxide reductase OsmC/OhrA